MTNESFDKQFAKLMARFDQLSTEQRDNLLPLVKETARRHIEIKEDVTRAKEALDEWRVTLKYAIFDREARRRELAD